MRLDERGGVFPGDPEPDPEFEEFVVELPLDEVGNDFLLPIDASLLQFTPLEDPFHALGVSLAEDYTTVTGGLSGWTSIASGALHDGNTSTAAASFPAATQNSQLWVRYIFDNAVTIDSHSSTVGGPTSTLAYLNYGSGTSWTHNGASTGVSTDPVAITGSGGSAVSAKYWALELVISGSQTQALHTYEFRPTRFGIWYDGTVNPQYNAGTYQATTGFTVDTTGKLTNGVNTSGDGWGNTGGSTNGNTAQVTALFDFGGSPPTVTQFYIAIGYAIAGTAVLEYASSLAGPWTNITLSALGTQTVYTVVTQSSTSFGSLTARYYRLSIQDTTDGTVAAQAGIEEFQLGYTIASSGAGSGTSARRGTQMNFLTR